MECETKISTIKFNETWAGEKCANERYNDVLLIPEGSTTIVISEIQPSNNYLAIRSKNNGTYYVNGNYRIDFPRSLVFAGCLWHYERDQQGLPSPDRFRSMGPTTEPLYLSLLLLQEVNVGIKYEYSIPSALVRPPNEQYIWVYEDFTPCSVTCGGGSQVRPVTCRSRDSLDVVEDNLCDDMIKPESIQACGTEPCPPQWVQGPWSPCSKPCGEGGTQSRQVYCERIIANGRPSIVENNECYKLYGPHPALHQRCNENATCPSWFVGPWKPCDKLCDEGQQTRQVVCHQKVDGRIQVFPDDQCSEEKPDTEKSCTLTLCEGVDWVLSKFTGCDTCMSNVRTRTAYCATKDRKVVNDSFCSYHPKPVLETDCEGTKKPKCEAIWYASQWGPCSVKCGKGVKIRRVFCGLFDGSSVTEVEDDKCDSSTKYESSIPCEEPLENCKADWFSGPWTECSKKCGGGQRQRSVMCLSSADVTPVDLCGDKTVPDSVQACNEFPCDEGIEIFF
ncbi:Papilin [Eumeta japonica]|uniref:Papilin n=1 Tax=Eumeta variegata TaxID=151549 RepID=A0A4C1X633_EUMVA|nr:Papilin [Eumeta japonica]